MVVVVVGLLGVFTGVFRMMLAVVRFGGERVDDDDDDDDDWEDDSNEKLLDCDCERIES